MRNVLNRVLLLALPLLLCMGCGAPVTVPISVGAAAQNPACQAAPGSKLASATMPAALHSLSPAVIQAGSSGASITLCASGVGTGAVIRMDGIVHAATLVNSARVVVTLSRDDIVLGRRRTFSIQNPGFEASPEQTLLVTDGYWAFGDSITFGYGLARPAVQNYPGLLGALYRLQLVNSARSGDQACDLWRQAYLNQAGYAASSAALYSVMVGTNDVDVKGVGAYEAVFRSCDMAVLTWLGTPRAAKVLSGDAALSVSGSCTGAILPTAYGGILCEGSTGSVRANLTTSGNPIYVWYLLSDSAGPADGVAVTLDSIPAGFFVTHTQPNLATQNGSTMAFGVVRIPTSAGLHVIQVSTRGLAGVLGFGSNPVSGADHPRLLVGDLPNQAAGSPVAPITDQLTYNAGILTIETLLQADGMDVRRAYTRDYMLGTVFEMEDQLHPNIVGQQELSAAFAAALP